MADPVIRRPLRCVQCGYDLEGLSARGACPECGREIVASLAHRLDVASPEPPLDGSAPREAWALFLAAAGCLLASLKVLEFAAISARTELLARQLEGIAAVLSASAIALHLVALLGIAVGLVAIAFILPRRHGRSILRVRGLGCAGFLVWLSLSLPTPDAFRITMAALPAAMVLLSLSPLLRKLGPASRAYRDRSSAKQRIDELIVALVIAGIASACAEFAPQDTLNAPIVTLLRIVAASSAGLALIGLCYLAVNAAWILRAIVRPDPKLADVLGKSTPDANGT